MVIVDIVVATLIVSLISLVGIVFFFQKEKKINDNLILFVAFAAGSLLGASFFHLIPESFESSIDAHKISIAIFAGISLFYVIEKFIHWHHHHKTDCKKHSLSALSLFGDGVHNFIDGVIIAGAFMTSTEVGILSTIAIIFHEIPQEIGDFSILLHSKMSKKKALLLNLMSALFAVLGGIIGYVAIEILNIIPVITAFAAGGFIYLSLADIIPEINNHENRFRQVFISMIILVAVLLSYFLTTLFHTH